MSTARRLSVSVCEQESGDNSGQAHVTLHSLSALLAESDPRYPARRNHSPAPRIADWLLNSLQFLMATMTFGARCHHDPFSRQLWLGWRMKRRRRGARARKRRRKNRRRRQMRGIRRRGNGGRGKERAAGEGGGEGGGRGKGRLCAEQGGATGSSKLRSSLAGGPSLLTHPSGRRANVQLQQCLVVNTAALP